MAENFSKNKKILAETFFLEQFLFLSFSLCPPFGCRGCSFLAVRAVCFRLLGLFTSGLRPEVHLLHPEDSAHIRNAL
jgi:hypothetical protein